LLPGILGSDGLGDSGGEMEEGSAKDEGGDREGDLLNGAFHGIAQLSNFILCH